MDDRLTRALLGQIEWWWNASFRPRLAGLTDEEFTWEPVADCWKVYDAGGGLVRFDFNWPPPKEPPVTTIAWRMLHIGVGVLAVRTTDYFPHVVSEPWPVERHAQPVPFPVSAVDAIAFLDRWWHQWRAGVQSLGADGWWRPIGPREQAPDMQLGPDDPMIGLVLHQHRELMHHGAEINLLRDLYAASHPRDALYSAILRGEMPAGYDEAALERLRADEPAMVLRAVELGRPQAVELAVRLGFDPDAVDAGMSALHHAAAGGNRAMAELLVGLGADKTLRDPAMQATPAQWARHFTHDELAAYLD